MPLYVYQCDQCQTTFDVRATFKEKDLGLEPTCPNCQGMVTHQILTTGLFIQGGSGESFSTSPPFCGPGAGPGCCG